MDHILPCRSSELEPYRTRCSPGRVGRADQLTQTFGGIVAAQYQRHHRPGGHKINQRVKEILALMDRIEPLSVGAGQTDEPSVADIEAILLDPADNLTNQLAPNRIRLNDKQRLP